MTLNVIVQNIIAVDSEVSYGGVRTSDAVEKSELFNKANYAGVVIGNGAAYYLLEAISFIRGSTQEGLDSLMSDLEIHMKRKEDKRYQDFLQRTEERIRSKYSTIADTERREAHITRDFGEQVDKIYEASERENNGFIYVVAYDKKSQRLRKYALANRKGATMGEFDLVPVRADGSGGDLADAYLATHTSGINWDKIQSSRNFYLISLACAAATANSGVGGFMKVAIVGTENSHYLQNETVNVAVRVCAKQIAGDISKKEAMRLVDTIFHERTDFIKLAKRLDMSCNDLLYSPARLHQDVAKFNRMHERKKRGPLDRIDL